MERKFEEKRRVTKEIVYDPATESVWKGQELVSLEGRAFAVLKALVNNPGILVGIDTLFNIVEKDDAAAENADYDYIKKNIQQCITKINKSCPQVNIKVNTNKEPCGGYIFYPPEADYETYYREIYDICKYVNIRDALGTNLSDVSDKNEVADRYVFPSFANSLGKTTSISIIDKKPFRRFVIAKSGQGKTSLLQAIVVATSYDKTGETPVGEKKEKYNKLADYFGVCHEKLPILIRGNDINRDFLPNEKMGLLDFAVCKNLLPSMAELAKSGKKPLLLIDALDEINSEIRKDFSLLVNDFLAKNPDASCIATCRPIELRTFTANGFTSFESLSLEQFSKEQIEELITLWYTRDGSIEGEENAKKRIRLFLGNSYLRQISTNPCMLSIGLLKADCSSGMVTAKEIINEIITSMIIKRWPEQKYAEYNFTTDNIRKILACIAYEMAIYDQSFIDSDKLADRMVEASKQILDEDYSMDSFPMLVKEMNNSAGLLILEKSGYCFQNSIIQSFLAAEWIRQRYFNQSADKDSINKTATTLLENDLSSELVRNMVVMLFSFTRELGRYDNASAGVFNGLLHVGVESLDKTQIDSIALIFKLLLMEEFGLSYSVTNITAQKQAIRFIWQNRSGEDLEEIKNREKLSKSISSLSDEGIIQ